MEYTTVKLPKAFLESLKDVLDLNGYSNKEFVLAALISCLPEDRRIIFGNQFKVSENAINRMTKQRSTLNNESGNKKKLERHLKKSELNDELIIGFIKLLMLDSGFSFPKDIQDRLDKFDDIENALVETIMKG